MKEIFRLALINMRTQPLLAALTVIGSAVSICLVMMVFIVRQASLADYGNEPNRSRTLYCCAQVFKRAKGGTESSWMGGRLVNEVFLPLKTPQAIAVFKGISKQEVALTGLDPQEIYVRAANADYFRIFRFDLLAGQTFTPEECHEGTRLVILSESVAAHYFSHPAEAVGQEVSINEDSYVVKAVVRDVASIMKAAYAQAWIPCSVEEDFGRNGPYQVAMLGESEAGLAAIRDEVEQRLRVHNQTVLPDTLDLLGQPASQEDYFYRNSANRIPGLKNIRREFYIIYLVLLVIPALNIASMTRSRLRQREAEIGVRRAFGATRRAILVQTFMESMVQTLLAGLLGLGLCFLLLACFGGSITQGVLNQSTGPTFGFAWTLDLSILFQPAVWLWTLLFCLILNAISSLVPTWRASRCNIVESLK